MAMIGDTEWHLHYDRYRYQIWDGGWVNITAIKHPNEISEETQASRNGQVRPELMYSDTDLLWAIRKADSLKELEKALRENRRNVDTVDNWDGDGGVLFAVDSSDTSGDSSGG